MNRVIRRFTFDAGHRIPGHESKCKHLHGHTYIFEVELSSPELDELGRVIDFGEIKTLLGDLINWYLDHALILWKNDHVARAAVRLMADRSDPQKVFLLEQIPTAENILRFLCEDLLSGALEQWEDGPEVKITGGRLWETPNCSAVWKAGD